MNAQEPKFIEEARKAQLLDETLKRMRDLEAKRFKKQAAEKSSAAAVTYNTRTELYETSDPSMKPLIDHFNERFRIVEEMSKRTSKKEPRDGMWQGFAGVLMVIVVLVVLGAGLYGAFNLIINSSITTIDLN